MPDVIKPHPEGGAEEEEQEDQGAVDAMGSNRDLPLQVLMLVLFFLGWVHTNGLPICRC